MNIKDFLKSYYIELEDLGKDGGEWVKKYWKWSLIAFGILFVYGVFLLHPFEDGTLWNAIGQTYMIFAGKIFFFIIILLGLASFVTLLLPVGKVLYKEKHAEINKYEMIPEIQTENIIIQENKDGESRSNEMIDTQSLSTLLEKCNLGTDSVSKEKVMKTIVNDLKSIKQNYVKGCKNDSQYSDKDIIAIATLFYNNIHPQYQTIFSSFCTSVFNCMHIDPPEKKNIKKQETKKIKTFFKYLVDNPKR